MKNFKWYFRKVVDIIYIVIALITIYAFLELAGIILRDIKTRGGMP